MVRHENAPRVVLADAYPHLQGGAQQQVRWLARTLRAGGVSAGLVTTALGPLSSSAVAEGTPTAVVPATGALRTYGGAGWRTAMALPAYWRRAAPVFRGVDVAHLDDHRGVLLYGPAARRAGSRVLWHAHALPAGRATDRACAAIADVIVAPSAASAQRLRRLGTPVEVLPANVPDPGVRWSPAADRAVVTVGRLHPTKGMDVLLEAVARLLPRRPDLRVELVGGADQGAPEVAVAIQRHADALGGAVTLRGHVDDPWPLVARGGVYVQPSRAETQGVAFAQALRVGVPIVASDLPALREHATAAHDVRFVPPGDVAALAEALAQALDTPPPHHDGGALPPDNRGSIDQWIALYRRLVAP